MVSTTSTTAVNQTVTAPAVTTSGSATVENATSPTVSTEGMVYIKVKKFTKGGTGCRPKRLE